MSECRFDISIPCFHFVVIALPYPVLTDEDITLKGKNVCLCGFNGLRNYNCTFIPKNLKELEDFIKSTKKKDRDMIVNDAKRYISDELKAGRVLKYYSMGKGRFKFLK